MTLVSNIGDHPGVSCAIIFYMVIWPRYFGCKLVKPLFNLRPRQTADISRGVSGVARNPNLSRRSDYVLINISGMVPSTFNFSLDLNQSSQFWRKINSIDLPLVVPVISATGSRYVLPKMTEHAQTFICKGTTWTLPRGPTASAIFCHQKTQPVDWTSPA